MLFGCYYCIENYQHPKSSEASWGCACNRRYFESESPLSTRSFFNPRPRTRASATRRTRTRPHNWPVEISRYTRRSRCCVSVVAHANGVCYATTSKLASLKLLGVPIHDVGSRRSPYVFTISHAEPTSWPSACQAHLRKLNRRTHKLATTSLTVAYKNTSPTASISQSHEL